MITSCFKPISVIFSSGMVFSTRLSTPFFTCRDLGVSTHSMLFR